MAAFPSLHVHRHGIPYAELYYDRQYNSADVQRPVYSATRCPALAPPPVKSLGTQALIIAGRRRGPTYAAVGAVKTAWRMDWHEPRRPELHRTSANLHAGETAVAAPVQPVYSRWPVAVQVGAGVAAVVPPAAATFQPTVRPP